MSRCVRRAIVGHMVDLPPPLAMGGMGWPSRPLWRVIALYLSRRLTRRVGSRPPERMSKSGCHTTCRRVDFEKIKERLKSGSKRIVSCRVTRSTTQGAGHGIRDIIEQSRANEGADEDN